MRPVQIPFIQLEPTNICNLDCQMCSRRSLPRFGSLKTEHLAKLLEELPDLQAIKLQGMGEPLMHPELFTLLDMLRARKIRTYSTSNATYFDQVDLKGLCARLDRLEISLDGSNQQSFETIRKGASFQKVIENIQAIVPVARQQETTLSLNCVYQKDNSAQIEELFALASRLGIAQLNLNPVQNWLVDQASPLADKLYAGKKQDCNPQELEQWALGYGLKLSFAKEFQAFSDCHWYQRTFYVTWDGYVTSCCQRPNWQEQSFGNIFEQGFEALWYSEPWQNFRKSLSKGHAPKSCQACSHKVQTEELQKVGTF